MSEFVRKPNPEWCRLNVSAWRLDVGDRHAQVGLYSDGYRVFIDDRPASLNVRPFLTKQAAQFLAEDILCGCNVDLDMKLFLIGSDYVAAPNEINAIVWYVDVFGGEGHECEYISEEKWPVFNYESDSGLDYCFAADLISLLGGKPGYIGGKTN